MASIARRTKISMAMAFSAAVLLGGCADGMEVNGRLLDAVGMSTAALSAKKEEPRVAPRAPLVMPPSDKRLPEPGSEPPPVVADDASWPKDKDQQRVASAAEKQRQHQQHCRDGNWKERAVDNDASMQGPLGSCGSLFSFGKGMFGSGPAGE